MQIIYIKCLSKLLKKTYFVDMQRKYVYNCRMNLYNLIMALFFMLGRKSFRKYERFEIEADCEIHTEHEIIHAKTHDASEG